MAKLDNRYKYKFFKIFFSIVAVFVVIVCAFLFVYSTFSAHPVYDPSKQRDSTLVNADDLDSVVEKKSIFTTPVRTNVLIVGVDKEESLTDVIMVASYISTTGEINLLSIPRDTYMNFTGESLTELRAINRGAPSIMKINAVYTYTKSEGLSFLQSSIEDMLGIKIDYYVKVNLEGFRAIVDTVGGIEFEVPAGGLKYSDPTQGLYIDLKEGLQVLNGSDAEGLVRFRKGYARQDLQRVEVQQEFIKEFIKQVLNKETLMKNIGGIAINVFKYLETDFGITDIPKYINTISTIDTSKLNNATLPGYSDMIDGISYYILNKDEIKPIVDDFFYGNTDPDKVISKASTDVTESEN